MQHLQPNATLQGGKSVETIYRGGNSKARNPKIQNMLRYLKSCL